MTTFDFISENEMQEYIDVFFRIYESWGFKKKIRSFVSPCGVPVMREFAAALAKF